MAENTVPAPGQDADIIKAVYECKTEAEQARKERMRMNQRNRDAFHGRQDWSHKQAGQSMEFLPKTASSVEQFAAFIKRGLTQFGDWFSVEMPEDSPLSSDDVRELMKSYLENMPAGYNKSTSAGIVLADGAKTALLESLMIIKVHGELVDRPRRYGKKFKAWRLRWDLIPTEDYYPDPTGRGLYEIHRVERDLFDVQRLADQGIYDKSEVNRLVADQTRQEQEARNRKTERREDVATTPTWRKRVVLDEFWGTLLNEDGSVKQANIVCTVANDRYLIRKPTENPWWHNQSPFVVSPLFRDPFTVWHRALYDQAVPLNEAMNELFNLMLDGGLAAVWGIKELRQSYLEDERQVAEGIPQGSTLLVNENAPPGQQVLTQVSTGTIPPEALAMFNIVDKEYNSASLTNEIKMGMLPSKQVKATEITEASQNQAVTLDALIADLEFSIADLLRKSWMVIMQNADDLEVAQVDSAAGRRQALMLARMSDKERYVNFGEPAGFRVHGLSSTMSRARDFQRLMAMLQIVNANPLLMQAFFKKVSQDKIITQMFKQLNLNPEGLQRDQAEIEAMAQEAQDASTMQQMGLGQGGGQSSAMPGMQEEVNQETAPSAGV